MQTAVHLPQFDLTGDRRPGIGQVLEVAQAARDLGFSAVSANDHLAFARPWMDGPTMLAAVAREIGDLELATTVALPVLRGPAQLGAALAALEDLAPGRVLAGVGPGSSAADFALARASFTDRWSEFEASVSALRALLAGDPVPPQWGAPLPSELTAAASGHGPIPIWVASWGSPAGLRRVARLGDGWLASAYNTSPVAFAAGIESLRMETARLERTPVPAALATMWTWVADDEAEARRVVEDVLAPALGRDPRELAGRVCVGTPERCAALLTEYAAAGCTRVYVWPVRDAVTQLGRLVSDVLPLVAA